MLALYSLAPGKIGDRAGNAENAVIAARRKMHTLKRGAHKRLALLGHGADTAQRSAVYAGITHCAVIGIAPALYAPRGIHALFISAELSAGAFLFSSS